MDMARATLVLEQDRSVRRVAGTRVRFSAHQCFAFDDGPADRACLTLLAAHLFSQPRLAVALDGDGAFLRYLLRHCPALAARIRSVIVEDVPADGAMDFCGIPVALGREVPCGVETIFLCETRMLPRLRMRQWLSGSDAAGSAGGTPSRFRLIDPDILPDLGIDKIPARAWAPWARDIIYPIDVPDIVFRPDLDAILIDCPARNLGLMPNGLGYVHNALKQVNVSYQTCDLDILLYHRFHIRRLCDEGGVIRLPSGRELPADPWQAEHYDLWAEDEVIAYFEPEIREIVDKLIAARPKVLGLSIQACSEKFSATVAARVKAALPKTVILVGGFSCYSPDIGMRAFPLADYMCIGEADLTVGPLLERLARGERPANTPGAMSRFDRPEEPFLPAPLVHDLDRLEHPRYEWYDLDLYRNYNGYQLTPVIASRGCRWSRCTFCAERFYWRIRSAESFVDELEWLAEQGCRLFMFNESDLNGKPEALLAICDEIMRRGLKIKLTGQLRIHKKCDRAFFDKLRKAGFVALRFGVDAFSENALKLQKKGYTTATVRQNLRDCWEAGIYTEVNWVIGVPGETDQDIEEGIGLILETRRFIGRLANINPLILSTGSVYWLEPEKHGIHFREDKQKLYRECPRAIPADRWYSVEPYIDENVRKQRFERVALALHDAGFPVGAWAHRIIEDVQKGRDKCRTGGSGGANENSLSGGVGRMEPKPEEMHNEAARRGALAFRAGSALPQERVYYFKSDVVIVADKTELYAVEKHAFEEAFGGRRFGAVAIGAGTIDLRARVRCRFARADAAIPELQQSDVQAGSENRMYNIVTYDGLYYAVPQQLGPDWLAALDRERGALEPTLPRGLAPRLRALRSWCWRQAKRVVKRVLERLGLRRPRPIPAPNATPWGEVDIGRLPGALVSGDFAKLLARLRPERLDNDTSSSSAAEVRNDPLIRSH